MANYNSTNPSDGAQSQSDSGGFAGLRNVNFQTTMRQDIEDEDNG